ncbi:MAG: hypothetical protein AAB376_01300, partial [Pseudomonadota bacterium]
VSVIHSVVIISDLFYLLPFQKTVPKPTIISGVIHSKNTLRYSTILQPTITLTQFSYKSRRGIQ